MKCVEDCELASAACQNKDCRFWIQYKGDLNCTLICVQRHGALTLKETADRLGVSYVRIKQIQDVAIKKINKKMLDLQ